MKTFQQFQQDLQEAIPLAIPAAGLALPMIGGAVKLAQGYLQARKQGEGRRSQPVDYGQGGETTPRTANVQRPSAKTTAARTQAQVARDDRRAEAQRRAQEKAEQGIEQLIGSDEERKAAAQARAAQPQIQQQLRRQATVKRMAQAADKLGLPEQLTPGQQRIPNAPDQVNIDTRNPGQKLRDLQLKVKYYGGYPPKGPV